MFGIKKTMAAVALVSLITVSAGGMVSASAGAAHKTGMIGSSGISRSMFSSDRLAAEAAVLKVSTAEVKTARADKSLQNLIKNAGLDEKTYHKQVKTELAAQLEKQGYSKDQITIAEQRLEIRHLKHIRNQA